MPYAVNRAGERAPYPEVIAALAADGIAPETVDVGGSPTAYHELFIRLWADGDGFVVVEHDVVVPRGAIRSLERCREPWCGVPYPSHNGYLEGALGCTRFSTSLVRSVPEVPATVDQLASDGTPRRYWGRLDTRLKQVLEDRIGLRFHAHWPAADHLNPVIRPPIVNCSGCGGEIPPAITRLGPPPYPCPRCD